MFFVFDCDLSYICTSLCQELGAYPEDLFDARSSGFENPVAAASLGQVGGALHRFGLRPLRAIRARPVARKTASYY